MANFEDTAIVKKLRRLMRNVPRGGIVFVSAHDFKRLNKAFQMIGARPSQGVPRYGLYELDILIERRKK